MHEAQQHEHNAFITLTYDDAHLPELGSLQPADLQKFWKRLRKTGARIRYFACGEYGSKQNRPHYHAAIFGEDFSTDRVKWKERNGHLCYRSEQLEKLWDKGQSEIGQLTFDSAAYIARYVTKKITGQKAIAHYAVCDKTTGEYFGDREPEYAVMSRRPGVGRTWFDQFHADVYPSDEVITRGHPTKPPKFYDLLAEAKDPESYKKIKRTRRANRKRQDQTDARLKVRETVTLSRLATYTKRDQI